MIVYSAEGFQILESQYNHQSSLIYSVIVWDFLIMTKVLL